LNSYKYLNQKTIFTIHHGVNTQRFSPTDKRNPYRSPLQVAKGPIVLFTGRFVTKKGPHILIHAIPKVLKHVPDAYFVFAGAGDFTPYMKLLKQENVPTSSFLNLGYVDSADMPKLYNLSSVYAAPSFEDSLGIRILEAMSCGKAVVASQVGGVPEIISSGQNGILVPPGDSEKLAEEIVNLLEDDNLRRKLAQAGREIVLNKFSSETMARQTAKLYENILHR
jgi:glycosyltransferase involved in cell wall biosynthesis